MPFLPNSSATRVVRRSAVSLMLLLALGVVGCSKGPNLQRVKGTLVVDGQPAAGANLLFFTPGQRGGVVPSANTAADGSFEIITNAKPGVSPGSYNVTVVWHDPAKIEEARKDSSGKSDPPDLLGGKYSVPDKSPLKAEITSSTKQLPPIELSTK